MKAYSRQSSMKKISIITVVYNAVNTIERTIQSVLSQSYKNIEYIIIDGGSTDGTLEVIAQYIDKIACFVSEPDKGIYDAMNKGIKRSTGDIIGLLNADDWYEEEALKAVADSFDNDIADIIYGNIYCVDIRGMKKPFFRDIPVKLFTGMVIPHPATFIRYSAYKKYGLYDTDYHIAADHELMLRMYIKGAIFKAIDTVIANFSCTGISSTNILELLFEEKKVFEKYKNLSPYKEETEKNLNRKVTWTKAIAVLNHNVSCVGEKMRDLLGKKHFSIWGTGIWGRRIFDIAKKNKFCIDFFVDSDPKKQGQKICGIDIMVPSALKDYDSIVFVAVKDHDVEIEESITCLNNRRLKCIFLEDFINTIATCYNKFSFSEK